MNKGKIYYIINNLLNKYDNGEKIGEDMFIDTLVKIRDIVEKNTNKSLLDENYNLQSKIDKAIEYINKHCVNEKISKEVGYKCYTMADTNELEKIMNILGDDK